MKTVVSVIVTCYNNAQYLDEALESVIAQTFSKWECVIVNDGSTDNTEEVSRKWVIKDERFKYIYQENRGVSNARNLGISQAEGEFILPLDADDKLSSNYIESCLNEMVLKNLTVAYGKAVFFGDRLGEMNVGKPTLNNLLQYNCIHCSGLFRKEDWTQIDGYDEEMKHGFEDWEFWINLLKEGGKAELLSNCFLNYRIKPCSRSTVVNNSHEKRLKMMDYIFQKHLSLYGFSSLQELYYRNIFLERKLQGIKSSLSFKELLKLLLKKVKGSFQQIKPLFPK